LPELNQTARELREAAEEMRRAAANSRNSSGAGGNAALERLREARRLLDENRSAGLQRDVEDALRRANRLAEEQRDVTRDVERLAEGGGAQRERLQRLMERKEEMATEVADLEGQLDRLARDSRREQRDASRKLQEAANGIRDDKLEDKIRYSRGVVRQRSPEYARNFEEQIARDIEELREKIEEARSAIGETKEQRLARALDETRDLVRSLQSLEERTQPGEGEQRGEPQTATADNPDGFPGLTDGDIRQFRREFRERRAEAEEVRRQLEREGLDTGELDRIVERLRQLERERPYGDPRGLAALQAEVIQGLKEFEYVLRREIGGGQARDLLLTGSDEVPPGYRELVEEYYKLLAEEGTGEGR
jgi:DNA repair exonuclease SbcCD ATPase subunit